MRKHPNDAEPRKRRERQGRIARLARDAAGGAGARIACIDHRECIGHVFRRAPRIARRRVMSCTDREKSCVCVREPES